MRRRFTHADAAAHQPDLAHPGMGHFDQHAQMIDLWIVEYFLQIKKRRRRHIVPFQEAQPMVPGCAGKFVLQNRVQRVIILDAPLLIEEPRVMLEFRPTCYIREAVPEFLRRREMNDKRQPVCARKCVDLGHMHPGILIRDETGGEISNGILGPESHGSLKQGGFDFLPCACPLTADQGALDCVTGVQGGQKVGQRRPRAFGILGIRQNAQQAPQGLSDRVVSGPVAVRAVRTVAGN